MEVTGSYHIHNRCLFFPYEQIANWKKKKKNEKKNENGRKMDIQQGKLS